MSKTTIVGISSFFLMAFAMAGSALAQDLPFICDDSCVHSADGECDDGGPGSINSLCETGTDCTDCGSRYCANTCQYAGDGECDDGGPGSINSLCAYGSDCTDCGVRAEQEVTEGLCSNTCQYANDGECDDGGPGSVNSLCELGTDCGDCGAREGGE